MCSFSFTQWEQFFLDFLSNTINIVKLKMKLRQWLVAVKVDKSREKENLLLSDNVIRCCITWNINKVDFGVFSVWILRT